MKYQSPKYMKKTLTELKRELYSSTVIVANFSILILIIEKLDKRSVRKQRTDNTMGKLDCGIYRALHTTTE